MPVSESLLLMLEERLGQHNLVGKSRCFQRVVERILLFAPHDSTVLITGETGTGKEVVARAMHYLSPRGKKPFVAVNCGALPVELVENELFGHRRSAFTGANETRSGLIAEAEGGTLFLDEIDSLALSVQVKLLRFLQEKEYRPLGSTRTHTADVRLVTATNADMGEAVREGRLRSDLYYRINVLPLHLPPLRERGEDLPLLIRHFVAQAASELGVRPPTPSPGAMRRLLGQEWPGNVRELKHVVERAVVLSAGRGILRREDLLLPEPEESEPLAFKEAKAEVVNRFERSYLCGILLAHGGNVSRASEAAGKHRRAFWQLIKKHGIEVDAFR